MRRALGATTCDHTNTRCGSWPPPAHPPPSQSTRQIFQSVSSFILASYSELLQQHSVIVYFLTMLVGAGGNAGNQAAVLVIRGLATGDVRGWAQYICSEVKMAVAISIIMVAAGFARVTLFHGSYQDAIAIASQLPMSKTRRAPPRFGQSGATQASPVPEDAPGCPKLRPASTKSAACAALAGHTGLLLVTGGGCDGRVRG